MRLLKKIFIISSFTTILLIIISSVLVLSYEDEIKALVLTKINNQFEAPIEINSINLSLIKKFPYTTLEINNIIILDVFGRDTLLQAEKVFLKLNALNLYNQNFKLNKIEIYNGSLNISVNQNGHPNYLIFKESNTDTEWEFNLNNLILNDMLINYSDFQRDIKASLHAYKSNFSGLFKTEGFTSQFLSKFYLHYLDISDQVWQKKTNIELNCDLSYINNEFIFQGAIKDTDVKLIFSGTHKKDNQSLFSISGAEIKINNLLTLIPERHLKYLSNYNLNGIINFNLKIQNNLNHTSPSINANFKIKNAKIKYHSDWLLESITMNGNYNNGELCNNYSSKIIINDLNGLINQNPFNGSLSLSNLESPFIKTDIKVLLDFKTLPYFQNTRTFNKVSGKAEISAEYEGGISFNSSWIQKLAKGEKLATINLNNITWDSHASSLQGVNGHLRLMNNFLIIDSLNGRIGEETMFHFVGGIDELFNKNEKLKIAGNLYSPQIKYEDIIKDSDKNEKIKLQIPKNIIANIQAELKNASFNRFYMSDFNSNVTLNNGMLKFGNITLSSMSGSIKGNIEINQTENLKWRLITTAQLNSINVRQLFYEFENFGQSTIRHNHLRGKTDSELYIRAEWDSLFQPLKENLYAFLDVTITDGELIEFEPMMLLSDYVSLDELKRIRFSTLKNQIEIKDKKVEVPFMEIESSAMDVAGSGTHFFNNNIDYDIEFSLKEVLNKKFRKNKKTKVSEFGLIEDDDVKGAILPLKMQGQADKPKISFNFKRVKNRITESLEKQKTEVKDLIDEEFNNNNNSSEELDKTPDYNNIIEWEDDEDLL